MSLFSNRSTEVGSPFGFTKTMTPLSTDTDNDERDIMYDSLCSLSKPRLKMSKKQHKYTKQLSPMLSLDEKKKLTFVLNECLSTDGKGPINKDIDIKLGKKRVVYDKTINSIGTSLNNCDLSDNISIDIEGESTYLPLMCKLMIIVEGAAYERGKRLLLNDQACQAGEGNIFKIDESDRDIPIIIESSIKNHLVRNQNSNENSLMKIRSNENINYDQYNEKMDEISKQRRFDRENFEKITRGGSLSDLTSSHSSFTDSSNYFSKKMNDSFDLELYEYLSTPFYGYQLQNLDKIDFSNDVQKEFIKDKDNSVTKQTSIKTFQDSVEIHIPIHLEFPEEYHLVPMKLSLSPEKDIEHRKSFRNEKQIMINHADITQFNNNNNLSGFQQNQDFNGHFQNQMHSFRLLSNNMRQFYNKRLENFENNFDLNFFEDNENFHQKYQFQEPNVIEVEHYSAEKPQEIPINHVRNDDDSNSNTNNSFNVFQNVQINHNKGNNMNGNFARMQSVQINGHRRKSSVTNLMFMRVVDGNIITSI